MSKVLRKQCDFRQDHALLAKKSRFDCYSCDLSIVDDLLVRLVHVQSSEEHPKISN